MQLQAISQTQTSTCLGPMQHTVCRRPRVVPVPIRSHSWRAQVSGQVLLRGTYHVWHHMARAQRGVCDSLRAQWQRGM